MIFTSFLMLDAMDEIIDLPAVEKRYSNKWNPLEQMTEKQFREHYRMSKDTFIELHAILHEDLFNPEEVSFGGDHTGEPVSTENQLLAVLRFYAIGSIQQVIGDTHGLSQGYVSKLVRHVSRLLAEKASEIINFPTEEQRLNEIKAGFQSIANFPGVVGLIDCTHVKVRVPASMGDRIEFYCRKGYFSLNCQFVIDDQMKITDLVARWPGFNHDSTIFKRSKLGYMLSTNPPNGHLLGDGGYALCDYLITPFREGHAQLPAERKFQQAHISTRNIIERFFGILKIKFACLRRGLNFRSLNDEMNVIVAIGYLWNFLLERGEIDVPPAVSLNDWHDPVINTDGHASKRAALIHEYFAPLAD